MSRRRHRNRKVFTKNCGCPLTSNRSLWCYGMCTPVEGRGPCGKEPHTLLRGRTQHAIAAQIERDGCEFDLEQLEAPELWCRSGCW